MTTGQAWQEVPDLIGWDLKVLTPLGPYAHVTGLHRVGVRSCREAVSERVRVREAVGAIECGLFEIEWQERRDRSTHSLDALLIDAWPQKSSRSL